MLTDADNILTNLKDLGINSSERNLIICSGPQTAKEIFDEIKKFDTNSILFPDPELLPYDFFSSSPRIRSERISALTQLSSNKYTNIITTAYALLHPCAEKNHISFLGNLNAGNKFNIKDTLILLEHQGYKRKDLVIEQGQYAVRGSIIDIFLNSNKQPIRIEIFDNNIESIRFFDPVTQISSEKTTSVVFTPSYEYPLNQEGFEDFKINWRKRIDTFEGDSEIFSRIKKNRPIEGIEIYLPLFSKEKTNFLSYLHPQKVFFEAGVDKKIKEFEDMVSERYENYKYDIQRPLLKPQELYFSMLEIKNFFKNWNLIPTKFLLPPKFNIKKEVILNKTGKDDGFNYNKINILPEIDDLVVHLSYGVGKFIGIKTINTKNITSDCLEIEYSDDSRVFVPIENMNLISKYFGPPRDKLDKLGSKKWVKRKEKAIKRTFDTAAELLEIQARRALKEGYSFRVPNEYNDFVKEFPYTETNDQVKTSQEIIEDLNSLKSMDRLLCGEVGFGKTEMAMRAAFICSYNSKQICILAPTTLLVSQHYQSFKERFRNYPIEIQMLSRNVTSSKKDLILEKLENGKIDIIIGTHSLLQPNIRFKDIGLVIIDEEHRFGVRQKERLKSLKEEIEVLNLSATPIPRSLNFALTELKDLSIMSTPPENRIPVKTFVYRHNDNLIKEAIQREVLRQGQVYYLCNDLSLIQDRKERILNSFPFLTVEIVHGKLKPRKIEKIMNNFHKGSIDVLVCSTIIESGIDVANANTLLVEDADRFGLAQLHQIRGRVGRGSKQAYAYFLRSKNIENKKISEKRLQALNNSNSLSAGFILAIKDLEIRGAGEILGSNQSGIFESIGIELYTRLLNKAKKFIQNSSLHFTEIDIPPEIILNEDAFIPESYLPDINVRLAMYNKISSSLDVEDLRKLKIEMINRFGLLNDEIVNLFLQTELKIFAELYGLSKVILKKDRISITFKDNLESISILSESSIKEKVRTIKETVLTIKKLPHNV
tara:strand:- start:4314 stop:7295 length:2982 start_codon:yes stop_codon:yes gene_type:complete